MFEKILKYFLLKLCGLKIIITIVLFKNLQTHNLLWDKKNFENFSFSVHTCYLDGYFNASYYVLIENNVPIVQKYTDRKMSIQNF